MDEVVCDPAIPGAVDPDAGDMQRHRAAMMNEIVFNDVTAVHRRAFAEIIEDPDRGVAGAGEFVVGDGDVLHFLKQSHAAAAQVPETNNAALRRSGRNGRNGRRRRYSNAIPRNGPSARR